MNYVQVIGRYKTAPFILKGAPSNVSSYIQLNVKSNFREATGEYRYDVFDVYLWKGLQKDLGEHIQLNTLIAVKGRLELRNDHPVIIAEQVEFLERY